MNNYIQTLDSLNPKVAFGVHETLYLIIYKF